MSEGTDIASYASAKVSAASSMGSNMADSNWFSWDDISSYALEVSALTHSMVVISLCFDLREMNFMFVVNLFRRRGRGSDKVRLR